MVEGFEDAVAALAVVVGTVGDVHACPAQQQVHQLGFEILLFCVCCADRVPSGIEFESCQFEKAVELQGVRSGSARFDQLQVGARQVLFCCTQPRCRLRHGEQ